MFKYKRLCLSIFMSLVLLIKPKMTKTSAARFFSLEEVKQEMRTLGTSLSPKCKIPSKMIKILIEEVAILGVYFIKAKIVALLAARYIDFLFTRLIISNVVKPTRINDKN